VTVAEVMREVAPEERGAADTPLPEIYAYSDETSRAAVEKMATSGLTTLLVVDRDTNKVCGKLGLKDLLLGRLRRVQRERQRARVFAGLRGRNGKAA
jgi:CBS domain containing-hemolysin-like protein